MTDFSVSDSFRGVVDTVSGATPLAALKQNGFTDSSVSVLHMFIGDIQGTIGETSALAILIGAAILLVFKVIDLKIPLTYIGSFAVFVILYMLGTGKGFDVNYLFSTSSAVVLCLVHGLWLQTMSQHRSHQEDSMYTVSVLVY